MVEYENVTIKVPKPIMELLRSVQAITGETPEQDIEYSIVESIRSRLDSKDFITTEALDDKFGLNPVFKEILDDELS